MYDIALKHFLCRSVEILFAPMDMCWTVIMINASVRPLNSLEWAYQDVGMIVYWIGVMTTVDVSLQVCVYVACFDQ